MNCDKYLELLSVRLDGALTEAEERELETHLESCPVCRAAGAQLAALQSAFAELEDISAPEGFTQDVMDHIRELEKTVPLFRRPRFKALAGLAACAVLAAGLYGAVRLPQRDSLMETRGLSQNALEEDETVSLYDAPQNGLDISTTAAGPDADTPAGETNPCPPEMTRTFQDAGAVYDDTAAVSAAPVPGTEILVLDRMPEGGWELILPDAYGSVEGLYVTGELLERIGQMAREQGITVSITSGTEEAPLHLIVVLEELE